MKAEKLSDHVINLARLSYQMECDRYDSLLSSSGRLLTCISISMVALMALLPIAFDAFPDKKMILGFEFLAVFAVIVASFICALIAQFRFKYQSLKSPASLAQFIVDTKDCYSNPLDAARNFADNLEAPYASIKARNTKITRLLIAASILLWVAIGMIVLIIAVDAPLMIA